jgi:hypothetical protein
MPAYSALRPVSHPFGELPALASEGHDLSRVLPVGESIDRARARMLRYRVAVLARSTTELLHCAGGWLFDRALAGWDVTVLAADPANPLPLRILGAEVVDLNEARTAVALDVEPHAVAVSAAFCAAEPRLRRWVECLLDRDRHEVTLWGTGDLVDPRLRPAQHRLSLAARMFKAHALAAAGDPAREIAGAEPFRTAGRSWPSVVDPVPGKRH